MFRDLPPVNEAMISQRTHLPSTIHVDHEVHRPPILQNKVNISHHPLHCETHKEVNILDGQGKSLPLHNKTQLDWP